MNLRITLNSIWHERSMIVHLNCHSRCVLAARHVGVYEVGKDTMKVRNLGRSHGVDSLITARQLRAVRRSVAAVVSLTASFFGTGACWPRRRWFGVQTNTFWHTFEQSCLPLCYRYQITIATAQQLLFCHFLAFSMLFLIGAFSGLLTCSPSVFDIAKRFHYNEEYQNIATPLGLQESDILHTQYFSNSFNCTQITSWHSSVKSVAADNCCTSLHHPSPIEPQQQQCVYCVRGLCYCQQQGGPAVVCLCRASLWGSFTQ